MKTSKLLIGMILAIIFCVNLANAECPPKYTYEWQEAYTKGPNGNISYDGYHSFIAVGKWCKINVVTGKKEPVIKIVAKYKDNKVNIRWTSKALANVTRCEKYITRPLFRTKFKKPGNSGLPDKYSTTILPTGKNGNKTQNYRADKKNIKKNISTPGKQVTIV